MSREGRNDRAKMLAGFSIRGIRVRIVMRRCRRIVFAAAIVHLNLLFGTNGVSKLESIELTSEIALSGSERQTSDVYV